MRYMITYYHSDGVGSNEQTTVYTLEALESFVKVLLSSGYRILSIE
jgi:hypothetical protein